MANKIEALRGMDDILPGQIEIWQWLEETARIFLESRFFKEIRTPILEYTDLFLRSVGESSDIVHKEMFSFEDRGGRNITLRPEMTAAVARCVIEKGLLKQAKSLRFYYIGPMFRAERPQAGRKRQFHQIGIEMINESGVQADFECIKVLYDFLSFAGLSKLKIRINDLGDVETQKRMSLGLADYFSSVKERLCEDCRWRLTKNVLRIFDCKNPSCRPFIEKAPWDDFAPVSESFKQLLELLDHAGIPFTMNRQLVRGLDYYNGAVFECAAEGLGAQDAVAGGGRYDRLHGELAGGPTHCTGFSIGMERLITALQAGGEQPLGSRLKSRRVYLAFLDASQEAARKLEKVSLELRQAGFRTETIPGEISLSKHLKKTNQLEIPCAVIVGSEELKDGIWSVKDMKTGEQSKVRESEIITFLKARLS